jgi:heme-degrading monooxygenase HmoA
MIVSKLTRKTAIAEASEWDKRAARLLERVRPFLERQPGFAGIDVRRGEGSALVEETRWRSMDDCRRYVREGAAATVATMADAILPTAPYPNGAWLRETVQE